MLVILIMSLQQSKLRIDKGFKGCYKLPKILYFLENFFIGSIDD